MLGLKQPPLDIFEYPLHVPSGRASAVVQFLKNTEIHEQQIRALKEAFQQNEQSLTQLQTELESVHSSLGWKAITLYRRIEDVLLPATTTRRKLYNRLLANFKRTLS